jgi:hypothetical protein
MGHDVQTQSLDELATRTAACFDLVGAIVSKPLKLATMQCMEPTLPTPHNNFFHFALSQIPNARSLIETQLTSRALAELDLD